MSSLPPLTEAVEIWRSLQDEGAVGAMMDFTVDFGRDIHIPHMHSSLRQEVPGWLTSVLQTKFWWFSLKKKSKIGPPQPNTSLNL